jgi:hypothetical protein
MESDDEDERSNKEKVYLVNNDSDSDENFFSCESESHESDKDQSHDDTLQDADANYKESSASVLNDNSKSQKEPQATSNAEDKVLDLPPIETFSRDDESPKDESENQSVITKLGNFLASFKHVLGMKPPAVKALEEIIETLIYDDNKILVIISFQPDLFQNLLQEILQQKYCTVSYIIILL